ncbi:MAG: ABC transporter substrate-binding protein [Bacteroidetes bacterium]|nr:ABC transporter substrate-binding protein [Bacteroidota bacterium]
MYYSDQLGNTISLSEQPKRIVSLVPSQTELLFDLGLEEQIVGVTTFCVHPADKVKGKKRIGGTKKLQLDKIRELQPDLIIGNKEENEIAQIRELQSEFPVWMSDIISFDDAFEMIEEIGKLVGKVEESNRLLTEIVHSIEELPLFDGKRVAYFIWHEPYMVAGSNTFIHTILERLGMVNVFGDHQRYPEVTIKDIGKAIPELILLSSEPFPFAQKHVDELNLLFPDSEVKLVDGEMFSWYGSRMRMMPDYMRAVLRPSL